MTRIDSDYDALSSFYTYNDDDNEKSLWEGREVKVTDGSIPFRAFAECNVRPNQKAPKQPPNKKPQQPPQSNTTVTAATNPVSPEAPKKPVAPPVVIVEPPVVIEVKPAPEIIPELPPVTLEPQQPIEPPFSASDFTWGVLKGLGSGLYQSSISLVDEFVLVTIHPEIIPGKMLSLATVIKNIATANWGKLAPQMVEEWNGLSSAEKGQRVGYLLGQ